MGAICVCLDCPNYGKGGWCRLKNRSTGALTPACADALKTKEEIIDERHDILTKRCTHCGRSLPVESFSLHKTHLDGRQSVCKECQKEIYKAWDERRKVKKAKESEELKELKEPKKTQSNKVIKEEPMETTNTTTKKCPRCGRELPHEAFGKHARMRDGLQPYCRDCRSQARKGKTSRPGREKATKYTKTQDQPRQVVVRETLTDAQMVEALRAHGWTVTCTRTITEEL